MKTSLRRQRDRELEEPYRSWIDGEVSLPAGVIFLPRKIEVMQEAMLFVAIVLGCVAMAAVFLPLALKKIPFDESTDSFLTIVLIGSLAIFLPLLTFRRLCLTIGALYEQRCGKLRQGIIVGQLGILVRLSSNKCYVIPLERFVKAAAWSGGSDSTEEFIRIETKDGEIDFSERSLAADSQAINQSVWKAREALAPVLKKQGKKN